MQRIITYVIRDGNNLLTIDSNSVTDYNTLMQENEQVFTLEELAELVGVPVRTIRFYITEGLLPGPGGRGKTTTYNNEHFVRLRLTRHLAERHVPLAEIRTLLAELSLDDARSLLVEEDLRATNLQKEGKQTSPRDYVAALLQRAQASSGIAQITSPSQALPGNPLQETEQQKISLYKKNTQSAQTWFRWELADGVELHVKNEMMQKYRLLVRRLLQVANIPENSID